MRNQRVSGCEVRFTVGKDCTWTMTTPTIWSVYGREKKGRVRTESESDSSRLYTWLYWLQGYPGHIGISGPNVRLSGSENPMRPSSWQFIWLQNGDETSELRKIYSSGASGRPSIQYWKVQAPHERLSRMYAPWPVASGPDSGSATRFLPLLSHAWRGNGPLYHSRLLRCRIWTYQIGHLRNESAIAVKGQYHILAYSISASKKHQRIAVISSVGTMEWSDLDIE